MFCSKCGYKNPDEFAFCQQCGNKLAAKTAPVQEAAPVAPVAPAPTAYAPVVPEPAPAAPAPAPVEPFAEQADFPVAPVVPQEPQSYAQPFAAPQTEPISYAPAQNFGAPAQNFEAPASAATGILRRIIVSPMFIVGSIAFTLSVILGAIKNFKFFDYEALSIYGYKEVRYLYDIKLDVYEVFGALRGYLGGLFKFDGDTFTIMTKIAFGLLAAVGAAVIAGLWLTFFAGLSSRKTNSIKTYGFLTLKISAIADLALLCLGFIGFEGLIFYRAFDGKTDESKRPEILVFAVLVMLTFAVAIALFVCVITSLAAVQRTAETGALNHKVSVFAATILALYAGIKVYAIILTTDMSESIFANMILGKGDIPDEIKLYCLIKPSAYIFSAIALICFAVLLIRYKYSMKTAREVAENN
ncbi:MAG: zinc ribbon domain-containing protein [Clostridia bacterium]|nr:zinc ribbon domain-containing protein [Clostridia bacterium]